MSMNDIWLHLISIQNDLCARFGEFSSNRWVLKTPESIIDKDVVSFKIWRQDYNNALGYESFEIETQFSITRDNTIEVNISANCPTHEDNPSMCIASDEFSSIASAFEFAITKVHETKLNCEHWIATNI